MTRTLCLALLAFSLTACGDDSPSEGSDAGFSPDAGPSADAGEGGDGGADPDRCGADCDRVIVDAAWLADHLGASDLAVLDTRTTGDFEAGHIPGSLWVDVAPLRATVDGVGGQVAPQADLQAAFRAAGLSRDDAVVVVGSQTTTGPARVFWTLEHAGHARVLFLDGGWPAWVAAGGEAETGAFVANASDYTIDALHPTRRVDADWVRDNLADEAVMLFDARSAAEFGGGRIANAVSVDWTQNVAGGSLRPRDEVLALHPGLDLATTTAVAYCQSGSRASVTYLVLRWLGVEDVRLYDGSWAEWSTLDEATYPRDP